LSTAREEEERGKEEWRGEWSAAGEAVTGARRGDGATIQEPPGCHSWRREAHGWGKKKRRGIGSRVVANP
jgi:hypothetical protein